MKFLLNIIHRRPYQNVRNQLQLAGTKILIPLRPPFFQHLDEIFLQWLIMISSLFHIINQRRGLIKEFIELLWINSIQLSKDLYSYCCINSFILFMFLQNVNCLWKSISKCQATCRPMLITREDMRDEPSERSAMLPHFQIPTCICSVCNFPGHVKLYVSIR